MEAEGEGRETPMMGWMRMPKEQFFSAFRRGEREGRIHWLDRLYVFASYALMMQAVTVVGKIHQGMDTQAKYQFIRFAMAALIAFTVLLLLQVKKREPSLPFLMQWGIMGCASAVVTWIAVLLT